MVMKSSFGAQENIEGFYLNKPGDLRVYLLVLREVMLEFSGDITEEWKYRTVFFYCKGKPFCYVSWQEKKDILYLGFVRGFKMQHPTLVAGGRTMVKVFYLDYNSDLPIESLTEVLVEAFGLY